MSRQSRRRVSWQEAEVDVELRELIVTQKEGINVNMLRILPQQGKPKVGGQKGKNL